MGQTVWTAANQAAMLALAASPGDDCIRTDLPGMFTLMAAPASSLANWQQITGQHGGYPAGVNSLAPARLAGTTTAGGPPTTGTWAAGDLVTDLTYGVQYLCTVAGTPGTWITLGSGRTLAVSKATTAVAGIGSTSTELSTIGSITVTAGPLPLAISASVNSVIATTAGALVTLAIFDEAFSVVWADTFTPVTGFLAKGMRCDTTETYPVGTSKTFHLYGRCQTAGTATFGSVTGGTCAWMKVALG